MDWDDAIEKAEEELGPGADWTDIHDEARAILSLEASIDGKQNHKAYLKSDEWRQRRETVLMRDNYFCQDCLKLLQEVLNLFQYIEYDPVNFKKRAEEVHHTSYINLHTSEEFNDCVSLCHICHQLRHITLSVSRPKLHEQRKEFMFKQIYQEILKQPRYVKEADEQKKAFMKSITVKPRNWLEDEAKKNGERWKEI